MDMKASGPRVASPDTVVGVTWRSVIAGLALSALVNYLAVRSYAAVNRYSGFADHFNTVGAIFLLFWFALLCLVARRCGRLFAFTPAEFAVVYAMLMVATVIPTMGYGGYLIPLITGTYYYASPENRWSEFLLPHLPKWASPQNYAAIRYLYEALPKGKHIPWGPWIGPLVLWTLFAFGFYLFSMGAMSLFRKQWAENEKLVYPLSIVPLQLCESVEGTRNSFFRSGLMWLGFGFAFFLIVYNYSIRAFPALMSLPPIKTGGTFVVPKWNVGIIFTFDTLVIGLASLMSLEVLSGIWIFHLLALVESGFLNILGLTSTGPAEPHAAAGPILANQQVGALLFLAAAALWTARGYLKRIWQKDADGQDEFLSNRVAIVAMLVGLAIIVWFELRLGVAGTQTAVLLLVTLCMFFGTARLLAQTGLGRLRAADSGVALTVNFLGSKGFAPSQMAGLGMNFVWAADIQLFVMGTGAHALKVLGDLKVKMRPVFYAMTAAFFVSVIVMYVSYLTIGYKSGLIHGFGWYFVASPTYHWGWIVDCIQNPRPPQWDRVMFMGIGAALAAVFSIAHYQIIGWPLHPAGLAICLTNTVAIDWLSIFIAWLVKGVVLRYAGLSGYRKIVPLYWGLILGSCVATGFTSLMDAFVVR